MNVLILTPDRVGSTLLQRIITVCMQLHTYDKPVINLHELTNGLIKYYNPLFNREVLGRVNQANGYFQDLPKIIELLDTCDHYKTSRLAHYHIKNRQDPIPQQLEFYQYLNENFFIISARRENLLEHALSWGIYTHTKTLNAYSHVEKINLFYDLYKTKITIPPETMVKYLDQYKQYLSWVDNHFTVGQYFNYEKDLLNIEQYVLDLPIFGGQPRITWEDTFGINFENWNKCHYLLSDISGIGPQLQNSNSTKLLGYNDALELVSQQDLIVPNDRNVVSSLGELDQKFLSHHGEDYLKVYNAINQLVKDKILVSPVPIKLQTFLEKKLLIKNFNQCVDVYNEWSRKNNLGKLYTDEQIAVNMSKELPAWHQQLTLAQ